jgi:hypothetical protein
MYLTKQTVWELLEALYRHISNTCTASEVFVDIIYIVKPIYKELGYNEFPVTNCG